MSWEMFLKKLNQIIKDLERQDLKLGDNNNTIALISISNLDSNSKLQSVARNLNKNQHL